MYLFDRSFYKSILFLFQGDNEPTRELYERLMRSGRVYMVTATVRSQLVIRFVVCSSLTEVRDVEFAWNEIRDHADRVTGTVTPMVTGNLDAVTATVTATVTQRDVVTKLWPGTEEHIAVKSLTQG